MGQLYSSCIAPPNHVSVDLSAMANMTASTQYWYPRKNLESTIISIASSAARTTPLSQKAIRKRVLRQRSTKKPQSLDARSCATAVRACCSRRGNGCTSAHASAKRKPGRSSSKGNKSALLMALTISCSGKLRSKRTTTIVKSKAAARKSKNKHKSLKPSESGDAAGRAPPARASTIARRARDRQLPPPPPPQTSLPPASTAALAVRESRPSASAAFLCE
jgi:hypothetical protein